MLSSELFLIEKAITLDAQGTTYDGDELETY
jgi:hypothetical protein